MLQTLYKGNKLRRVSRRSLCPYIYTNNTDSRGFPTSKNRHDRRRAIPHIFSGGPFWFVISKRHPLKSCGYKLYWESKKSMDTQNIQLWQVRSILGRSTFKACKIPPLKTPYWHVA